MERIIEQSLAGRRFALIGFETPERDSIVEALGSVRGFGHVVGAAPSIPGLNSFAPFDACVVNASAAGAGDTPSPIELVARSRKPAVIIGSFEDLVRRFAAVAELSREFILRPWVREELLLRAYRVLSSVKNAGVAIQAPARNGVRRVVLADDDAATVVMISTILKHFRFECEVARDGAEACAVVRKKRPDLVLLDVSMPRLDGFEALAALRSDLATRSTPVILVSAHRDEAEVVKAFSLGADDYITKPFNSGELMARINRVLREPEGQ
jgi:CheY-like chemotaxis protein